jgi:Family of unknown function (DUF6941)
MATTEQTQIDIDFMILADGAQAVGGKLYMLGGGWTHVFVPQFPGPPIAPFAIALGLTVPYHLTNRRFSFVLELTDADGTRVGEVLTGEFEQGRPPGLRAGASQPILLAINARPEFPQPGRYSYNASIDGKPIRSIPFEAVQQIQPQERQQQESP